MLIEIIADILIALSNGLVLLLAIAYFDRYLVRRRGSAANAAYVVRMHASRTTFDFHWIYRSATIKPNEVILPALEPKMLTASPTLLLLTSGKA